MDNMGYGKDKLKYIVEKEARGKEENITEQKE